MSQIDDLKKLVYEIERYIKDVANEIGYTEPETNSFVMSDECIARLDGMEDILNIVNIKYKVKVIAEEAKKHR